MKTLLFLSLTLASFMLYAQNNSLWQQFDGECPSPRTGHSMVEINGILYLFGGESNTSKDILNDLWSFSKPDGEWEKIPSINPPAPRKYHATTRKDGKMFVFGGYDPDTNAMDVWEYNPDTNNWTLYPLGGTIMPQKRESHTATTMGDNIYICMGSDTNGLALSDFWCCQPTTGIWTPLSEHPGGCTGHGAFPYNEKIYVFGGYDPAYPSYRNDIWSYNISANCWEYVNAMGNLPGERAFFAMANDFLNSVYIFGGQDDSKAIALSDSYKFDASTSTWTQLADGPACSYATAAYLNDTSIYLFGGLDEFGNVTDNFWRYNPTTDTWEEIFVGIDNPEVIAHSGFSLSAYPNPFNYNTTIKYQLKNSSYIELKIFNIKGELVNTLVNDFQDTGNYSVVWNGTDESGKQLSQGMYVYELELNGKSVASEKCLLLK